MVELDHGYLTIARIAGDPAELLHGYGHACAAMDGVGLDHGLLVHVAARTEDGLMIVNLWPSPDGSEAAARDPRRLRKLVTTGIDPARMTREHHRAARVVLFGRS